VKIALVVPGGVDRSGERRVIPALLALIERLADVHEVHVFALAQEPKPASWMLAGATIHNIGGRWRVPRTICAIEAEHRRGSIHLVQAIFSGACGLVCVLAARRLRVPAAVHVTGGEVVAIPEVGYGAQLSWRWRFIEPRVLRAATQVTGSSACVVDAVKAFGVPAARVPLGVGLREWPVRPPVARAPGVRARLLHVASLNRVKDQDTLLHAIKRVADAGIDFHLDVVGEDTLGGQVQSLADQLGLASHMKFHGFLTQRELRPLMETAHVHVFSSRHEAGPFVLLEAAIAGVPTVATRVGHVAEWPAEAVIAVDIADARGLAAGILRLLHDEELRLRMARAAQQLALAENADHTASCFLQLHEMLGAN